MSFEVRAIRTSEIEECIALWRTVWPYYDSDHNFRRYFSGSVDWRPSYTQVGVLEGKLVSAVQICKRIVACGEFRLIMGGIANVATLPEYRGAGYSTRCLQGALAVMEAEAMDFALLFTGIHDYYASFGFAKVSTNWLSGIIRPNFRPRPSAFTVRPVVTADFEPIYRIYDSYNRTRPITVRRTPAYWRDWIRISTELIDTPLLVAIDSQGAVCDYMASSTFRSVVPNNADAEGIWIHEFGVDRAGSLENEYAIMQALLDSIAAHALENGQNLLRLDLVEEPAIQKELTCLCSETHERPYGSPVTSRQTFAQFYDGVERAMACGGPPGRHIAL